jgi:hypothetical protein
MWLGRGGPASGIRRAPPPLLAGHRERRLQSRRGSTPSTPTAARTRARIPAATGTGRARFRRRRSGRGSRRRAPGRRVARQRDDRCELLARVHGAGRVVRAAQQERRAAAAGCGRAAKRAHRARLRIDAVVGVQGRLDHAPFHVLAEAVERRVHGRVDDHRVATARDQLEDLDDPAHHVGHVCARVDVDLPAPALAREVGEGLGVRGPLRVAGVADRDRVDRRRGRSASASGTSISATHSGSTSAPKRRHFMLVRRRSSSSDSTHRGLVTRDATSHAIALRGRSTASAGSVVLNRCFRSRLSRRRTRAERRRAAEARSCGRSASRRGAALGDRRRCVS